MPRTVPMTEFDELKPDELHLVRQGANGFSPVLEKQVKEALENAGDDTAAKDAGVNGTDTASDEAEDIQEQMTKADVHFCGVDDCEVCAPWLAKVALLPEVEKAKLNAADRKKLPKSQFAIPEKAPRPGSYPINDRSHASNALSRSSGKPVAARVRAAVQRKFPGMGAAKSPGIPDNATRVDLSMYGGKVPDTARSGLGPALVSGTKPPAKVDTPGVETPAVAGSDTQVIPIADRVLNPPPATLARKTAWGYAQLAAMLENIRAQQEGQASKAAPWIDKPAADPDALDDAGFTGPFDLDSVSLSQILQLLAYCGKALDAVQKRAEEVGAEDVAKARQGIEYALAIASRLIMADDVVKTEEGLEKAGYDFSPYTTATLLFAHDHLSQLIDARNSAGTAGATEADEIMTTLTKEQLATEIKDGATAVVKETVDAAVKGRFKKSEKRLVKAFTEALKAATSNNKGEVSERDIRGMVRSTGDADDLMRIPDAGQVLPQYANKGKLDKKAKKLEKKIKAFKKQRKVAKAAGNSAQVEALTNLIKETNDLVRRLAKTPRAGGPHLTGQPTPEEIALRAQGRMTEPATKKTGDGDGDLAKALADVADAQKEFDEAKKGRGPEGAARLSEASIRLSKAQLYAGHLKGEL